MAQEGRKASDLPQILRNIKEARRKVLLPQCNDFRATANTFTFIDDTPVFEKDIDVEDEDEGEYYLDHLYMECEPVCATAE